MQLICYKYIIRFTVAIKSAKKGHVNDEDVDLLMDEAKTMFSIGTYHENIVNLQGIGYEADFVNGNLSDVSPHVKCKNVRYKYVHNIIKNNYSCLDLLF